MTATFLRSSTSRSLRRAREQFGEFHPATFAAYGRAHVAWSGRVRPPRPPVNVGADLWISLCAAYTTAQVRAYGGRGHDNRRARRHSALARGART